LDQFSRTELLLGRAGMEQLADASVAVFGLGGVGSYTVEALARSGVGQFALIDDDQVCLTNINRQLIATIDTVGRNKVDVMRERVWQINPRARIAVYPCFYGAETAGQIDVSGYSYVVDAIDTISAKLLLIERAKAAQVPVISCMGAGNKLDATRFEVADISETSVCPLAKVMRKELRARGIEQVKVVYSKEPARTPLEDEQTSCKRHCVCPPGVARKCTDRRQIPGSVAFVPSVAGLIIAGEVVKDLLGLK
jgi:tRNA A37 threonylcarbamoyladenosine dehydratase